MEIHHFTDSGLHPAVESALHIAEQIRGAGREEQLALFDELRNQEAVMLPGDKHTYTEIALKIVKGKCTFDDVLKGTVPE